MAILRMSNLELRGKRVLIREDLNVPLDAERNITSAQRLSAALPTIRSARDAGARVMVLSHLGRPHEGEYDPAFSLEPVAEWLQAALGTQVRLVRDYLDVRTPALPDHACAVGWNSAFEPLVSVRFSRPAPHVNPAMRTSVQPSTTRQPTVHSASGVSGLRSR